MSQPADGRRDALNRTDQVAERRVEVHGRALGFLELLLCLEIWGVSKEMVREQARALEAEWQRMLALLPSGAEPLDPNET